MLLSKCRKQWRQGSNHHYYPTLPDDQVKLTYIIVNKKINTKFISSPSPANPLCGTVIDDVVTLPER